ncbi:MAG: hypothetical protein ACJA2D_002411 [Pseudohongiellaceae bacterium]
MNTPNTPSCPVCSSTTNAHQTFVQRFGDHTYDCPRCGFFHITGEAFLSGVVSELSSRQKSNLSAWLSRNPREVILLNQRGQSALIFYILSDAMYFLDFLSPPLGNGGNA